MPQSTAQKVGTFCWSEVATSDAGQAKDFYSKLFALDVYDHPMGDHGVYTMLRKGEQDVSGLYQLNPEQVSNNVPPHWLAYIAVENADETTERAQALGGQTLMGPFDVMDMGRMSVIMDPTGAVFAIWQAKQPGNALMGEPDTPCWNELVTSDITTAGKFYADLIGWELQEKEMGDGKLYTLFMQGEIMAGGMMELTPEMGDAPPHWMLYFAVDDCDQKVASAESLGGTVLAGPMEIPEVGRMAVLQDPSGAVFSVIKLLPPPS